MKYAKHEYKIITNNRLTRLFIGIFLRKRDLTKPTLTKSKVIYRHVLSVDIVGLSRKILTEEEQTQKIEILNTCLAECEIYKNTQKNRIFHKSTGDGFIIAVTDDLTFPIELAIQLQKQLQDYNRAFDITHQIKIRMGIHSGTSSQVHGLIKDEWGDAVVGATRIMSFGESDHILLSSKVAMELIQLSTRYRSIIHSIGEYSAKHGVVFSVFSAFDKDFGNHKSPKKFFVKPEKLDEYDDSIEINSMSEPLFDKFLFWLIRLQPFVSDSNKPPMSAQRFVNLFKLMREYHLSISEVLNLRKNDFDIKNKIIMIRYQNSDKVERTATLLKENGWIQKFLWYYNDEDFIFTVDNQTVVEYANNAKNLAGLN
jgi:hypothetical protein